ncbi:alpha-amylase family glycosyl hydrolase [Micromonospora sp. BRA006-A]|nr:alpha-amylase family glycosyl hydrolase [Micromonospora sp. BRA006-A]
MHRRRCRAAALALGLAASLLVPLTAAAPRPPPPPPAPRRSSSSSSSGTGPRWPPSAPARWARRATATCRCPQPQEHVNSSPWWVSYQPVSYRIESRKGTRAQFQSMVNTCHAAGVKVIVDAVVNHMSGQENGGTGWAGSLYGHYNYPGTYSSADFHYCGRNGNNDIANYNDRYEVQNCELVNLADLKTESEYVRSRLAAYLNDLLSLGVDGFRLDGSKHMPAADIAAIKAAVPQRVPGAGGHLRRR